MGDTTSVIMGLRPVRFRYNSHGPNGPVQYGLIAEEVDRIAPEMVGHDKDGQIDSVYYEKVNAMLLNEVQKQYRLIEGQAEMIRQLESRLDTLERQQK